MNETENNYEDKDYLEYEDRDLNDTYFSEHDSERG